MIMRAAQKKELDEKIKTIRKEEFEKRKVDPGNSIVEWLYKIQIPPWSPSEMLNIFNQLMKNLKPFYLPMSNDCVETTKNICKNKLIFTSYFSDDIVYTEEDLVNPINWEDYALSSAFYKQVVQLWRRSTNKTQSSLYSFLQCSNFMDVDPKDWVSWATKKEKEQFPLHLAFSARSRSQQGSPAVYDSGVSPSCRFLSFLF